MEDKESGMNDIAGLMALMQNNKGMDLPGILALCQQKGYGREGGGWGDGMGLLVILLFFLMFNNGGWGNNGNKAIADSTAASVVQSLQGFAISHYKPTQTATAPTA